MHLLQGALELELLLWSSLEVAVWSSKELSWREHIS
jgi:hypothetical protein